MARDERRIILSMGSTNMTPSLTGWAHAYNDPWNVGKYRVSHNICTRFWLEFLFDIGLQ